MLFYFEHVLLCFCSLMVTQEEEGDLLRKKGNNDVNIKKMCWLFCKCNFPSMYFYSLVGKLNTKYNFTTILFTFLWYYT